MLTPVIFPVRFMHHSVRGMPLCSICGLMHTHGAEYLLQTFSTAVLGIFVKHLDTAKQALGQITVSVRSPQETCRYGRNLETVALPVKV